MGRLKGLILMVFTATVMVALSLTLYPYLSTLPSTQSMVEKTLEGLGYSPCGYYTARPGEVVTFSREFNDEVRCYLIVTRPALEYAIVDPRATLVIEPPSNKTVYRFALELNAFFLAQRFSYEIMRPHSEPGAGPLRIIRGIPGQYQSSRSFKDDFYVVFSYKPLNDGYPVKITLTIHMNVTKERVPAPTEVQHTYTTLVRTSKPAQQLGIKDIKAFMSYLGYELCGEFWARDTVEVQEVSLEVEIDPNIGRACYILIHPPPKKALLITYYEHKVTWEGDLDQLFKYSSALNDKGHLIGTPFSLQSAFEVLGLSLTWTPDDVPEPYSKRYNFGMGSGERRTFLDNTPALIYFALKGDVETFGEPLRFRLKQYVHVIFTVIEAAYIVEVK